MRAVMASAAVLEIATGIGLMAMPDFVIRLLLGIDGSDSSILVGRVVAIALLALGLFLRLHGGDRLRAVIQRGTQLAFVALEDLDP